MLICLLLTAVSFTISPEIDAASSYLAFQSLQSYGPCLQKSASEEKELFDLTDGFSVAALKVSDAICDNSYNKINHFSLNI